MIEIRRTVDRLENMLIPIRDYIPTVRGNVSYLQLAKAEAMQPIIGMTYYVYYIQESVS